MKDQIKKILACALTFCILVTTNGVPAYAVSESLAEASASVVENTIESAAESATEGVAEISAEGVPEGVEESSEEEFKEEILSSVEEVNSKEVVVSKETAPKEPPSAKRGGAKSSPPVVDVTDLITEWKADVTQSTEDMDEFTPIDSTKALEISVSFRVPLIGDGGAVDTYVKHLDTAMKELAKGFKLDPVPGPLELTVKKTAASTALKVGTVTLSNVSTDRVVMANIEFDGDEDIFKSHDNLADDWSAALCTLNATLYYDGSGSNDGVGDHEVTILGKTYKVNVPEPSTTVKVEKSGTCAGQLIDWVVEVDATKSGAAANLADYAFSDDIKDVGTYVVDSFKIGTTNVEADADVGTPEVAAMGTKLGYTFPANTIGTRYIFFQTKISDAVFYANEGQKTITNTAQILKGGKLVVEDAVQVVFESAWIKKEALESTIDHTNGTIEWAITANQLGATLPDATVTDVLDSKLRFVSVTLQIPKSDGGWENSATSITPQGDVYSLGTISTPVRLIIKAELRDKTSILHTIQTVENEATLRWTGHSGIVSNTAVAGIGHNPITKTGVVDPVVTANGTSTLSNQTTWTVKTTNSDRAANLRVVELLVYGDAALDTETTYTITGNTTGTTLTQVTDTVLRTRTPNLNQRYVDNSFAHAAASDLHLTKHTVQLLDGTAVADLLVVTGPNGAGIDVGSAQVKKEQTFTYKTEVVNPSLYLKNSEYKINNTADLLEGQVEVNKGAAQVNHRSNLLYKDTLPRASTDLDLEENVNVAAGGADGSFNYVDHSVVFRLHVNANGVKVVGGATAVGTNLGDATITDKLPVGWEFGEVTAGKQFLIYEAQRSAVDSSKLTTAVGVPVDASGFITANFAVNKNEVNFTFTALDRPYMILLRAKPIAQTAKEYFGNNSKHSITNNVKLTVVGMTAEPKSSTIVSVQGKALTKTLATKKSGQLIWQLDYNSYTAGHPTAVITDILPNGLDVRTDSKGALQVTDETIKIEERTVQENGGTAAGTLLSVADVRRRVSYDGNSRKLTFQVPDVKKTYRFNYLTDVTGEVKQELTNKAYLGAVGGTGTDVGQKYEVRSADASATMQRSGWVKLVKKDDQGVVLSGAEFTVFTEDGKTALREGVTSELGELTLRGLLVGKYILRETKAPVNHAASKAIHTVMVVNNGGTITTTVDGKSNVSTMEAVNFRTGQVGHISVSKKLQGNSTDAQKEFDFTMTVTGAGSKEYDGIKNDKENVKVTFVNDAATFRLKGGESLSVQNLPKDGDYAVTEADYSNDDYSTTKKGDVGTVIADVTQAVAFTNIKNVVVAPPLPVEVTLRAEKLLDDQVPTGSDYSFLLQDVDGKTLQTKKNSGKQIVFNPLAFDKEGTFHYTLMEEGGGLTTIKYDKTIYTAVVTVTKNANYEAAVTYLKDGVGHSGSLVFKNSTIVVPPTSSEEESSPSTPSISSEEESSPSMPSISSGEPPAVSSDENNSEGGMSNSKSNASGVQMPPRTGDSDAVLLWFVVMLISAGSMVILLARKKKNSPQK